MYTCEPAQNPSNCPQVLPAYGLQDLWNEHQEPKTRSNPNTMCPQITLGENHGTGHFYLAENRTFLLCVDTKSNPIQSPGKRGGLNGSMQHFLEVYSQESENLKFVVDVDLSAALLCSDPTGNSRLGLCSSE